MLFLICGTPGSGKTLYTLNEVEKRRKDENRKVFYSGIPDLALDWEPLENPQTWHLLPDKAIVVIDECQRVFPIRSRTSSVPEYIAAFETHRHRGLDIYLVTQHPQLIDNHVRKLVGEYKHLDRPFGHDYTKVWRFPHVCDWKSTVERQGATQERWKFPKESYQWYKSAEAHTHKKTIPGVILWIPILLLLIGFCGYTAINWFSNFGKNETPAEAFEKALPVDKKTEKHETAHFGGVTPTEDAKRLLDPMEYALMWIPRLPELPFSAPVYDEVAKPTGFPKVSICYQAGDKCECYTQQATKLFVAKDFCEHFVKYGQFDPFQELAQNRNDAVATGNGEAQTRVARSAAVPEPQKHSEPFKLSEAGADTL